MRFLIIGALLMAGAAIAVWGPSFSSDKGDQTATGPGTATANGTSNGGRDVATVEDKIDFVIKDSSGKEKQRGSTGN